MLYFGWVYFFAYPSPAQDTTPYDTIELHDLSAFDSPTVNWQVAGGVRADRHTRHALEPLPGAGILINRPTENARGNLFTGWSHGDLELDLEILMPRESNSGIYFQSRYEIQLLDSWGKHAVTFSDMGGIYERWDEDRPEGRKGYEGHAPAYNVARAPGLWQHLNVVFQAPRFDESGQKIQNARFVRVTLNGVVIHENVEVTGPTRAAAFGDEVPEAPLMIQGDHGPVALRRIRYRRFDAAPPRLSNLELAYFEGAFNHRMPALDELEHKFSESTESVTVQRAEAQKQFAIRYTGTLHVPRTGRYQMDVAHTARFSLAIDGRPVLSDQVPNTAGIGEFPRRQTLLDLEAGGHPFELVYAKGLWHSVPTALGWYMSGPGMLRTELTAPGSLPADAFGAFRVEPTDEPILQRNFVMHGDERRTHAISVGFPGHLHYAYDLSLGALLHVWKGPFIDTSTMWYERGELQSAVPLGSIIEMAGTPTILIADENSADGFRGPAAYRFEYYRLDDGGRPTYTYRAGEARITDTIVPDPEDRYFTRTLVVEPGAAQGLVQCVLIESDLIELVDEHSYVAGDRQMYVEIIEGGTPAIRQAAGRMQLVLPVRAGAQTVRYNLVW